MKFVQSARQVDVKHPHEFEDQVVTSEDETEAGDKTKQSKNGKLLQVAVGLFEEYCSNSTLHGVRYFVDKKRHWLERIWWMIGFIVSMSCCAILIYNVYDNWDQRSVIVSISDEVMPVWDIPFPAVTICPTTKAEYNLSDMFPKRHSFNNTDEEANALVVCSHIRGRLFEEAKTHIEDFAGNAIRDVIRKIAPKLSNTLNYCRFGAEELKCDFEEIITEQGLCYTFNMLNVKETYNNDMNADYSQMGHNRTANWNSEDGYDPNIDIDSKPYPYRVFGSGADGDKLNVGLKVLKNYLDTKCDDLKGYKVVLHTPGEIPQVSKYYFDISILETIAISVKPNIITTSNGLKRYHHNSRKCYFDSERKLRFLRVYTQRNCELECLSNFTFSLCGCVQFSMPRDAKTPVCDHTKFDCYNWARDSLLKGKTRSGQYIKQEAKDVVNRCDCMPACNSITYDAEIIKLRLLWVSDEIYYTDLNIFFKENEFITMARSERYGPIDFVANCGGLLGLFIGASFLSIVELLYFCSLRLCCRNQQRLNRKGTEKIHISTVSQIIIVKPATESDNINY